MSDSHTTRLPTTRSGYVTEYLREAILSGKLAAGSKIEQQLLADELNVSSIPVREGIKQLEAEGLIRNLPYKGAFVATLSATELIEIYQVREVLEAMATAIAVPQLSAADIGALANILEAIETATRSRDYSALLTLNRQFHFLIYDASHQSLLLQLITGLWDRASAYRHVYTYLPERAASALSEHRLIFKHCATGDAENAAAAVRQNVHQTTEGVLARLHGQIEPASEVEQGRRKRKA